MTIKERLNNEIIASGCLNETVVLCEGQWYFAPHVVNMAHLKITNRTYTCSYKGVCYWVDLDILGAYTPNIGWIYRDPKKGFEYIKDKIGFYPRDTIATMAIKEEI